jgi:hypothetical protein
VSGRWVAGAAVAAVIVAWVGWDSWSRRQENAALRAAGMEACSKALGDSAACATRIARDHDQCRTLATTYHGKRQGMSLNTAGYADCVTRGPDVIRAERQSLKKAQDAQRGNILR